MTVGERWEKVAGRPSGFDYTRIALALAVVLWHSYQVSYGSEEALRFWVSNPAGRVLEFILPMFFALSGFLVAGSMYRNSNLRTFLTLRAIRIFPALVVEVAIAALVLGPAMTSFDLARYFLDGVFFKYFLNMVGYIHYVLPGVFVHNTEPNIVNSQLWTVPFELECYILIAIIAVLGFFVYRRRVIPLFAFVLAVVAVYNHVRGIAIAPAGGDSGRLLVLCFLAGVVIYAYRDRIPYRADLALAALIVAVLVHRASYGGVYLIPVLASYLVVYVGLLNPPRTVIVSSGDYSYGMYLYSCPIQQAVEQFTGHPKSYLVNVGYSLPIIVAVALFSWWCVEKPFLKVRRFVLAAKPAKPIAAKKHATVA